MVRCCVAILHCMELMLIYTTSSKSYQETPSMESTTSGTTGPSITLVTPKSNKPAKGRGDRRRWMTPEQLKWLLAQFPYYLEAQSHGRYDKFWPGFFKDWFKKFPACEPTEDDPSNSEGEVDDDNGSDDDDAYDAEEVNGNTGAAPKRKQVTNKTDTKKKKKKKSVGVLSSSCTSITNLHRYFRD